MEVHIVHRNMAYSNFSDALWHEDGVVVVAAFFQVIQQFFSSKFAFSDEHVSDALQRRGNTRRQFQTCDTSH